jgi:ERCC4-type nuclease
VLDGDRFVAVERKTFEDLVKPLIDGKLSDG